MCFVVIKFPSTSKLRDLFPSWLPRFLYSFREWRYEIKAYFVIITAMYTQFWLSFSKGKFSQENQWTDTSVASCFHSTHSAALLGKLLHRHRAPQASDACGAGVRACWSYWSCSYEVCVSSAKLSSSRRDLTLWNCYLLVCIIIAAISI